MQPRHEEETERRSWFDRFHLSWPMLFLVGWVLYELTAQPTLGAVAVCLKFGWADFRAAIWLRRVDPWGLRGRACFWLYLASGLAKTAGVACGMSFAFLSVSPKGPAVQGPRWAAIMEMAAWTGLTTLAGLICATLTFGYAAVLARWGGFKLWLSRDIHRARRSNDWPPYELNIIEENRLNFLLIGALLVVFFPPAFFVLLMMAMLVPFGDFIGAVLGPFLMIGVPVLVLRCKDRASRWLIASHPVECWETSTDSLLAAESMAGMIGDPLKYQA